MERISGPYRGYFMVTTARGFEGRFVGRTCVTSTRPQPGEPAEVVEEVISSSVYKSRDRAMQAAEFQARQVLDGMAPCWEPFTMPGVLD